MRVNLGILVALTATIAGSGVARAADDPRAMNKAVVARSEAQLWSAGNLDVADAIYAPDFVGHFPGGPDWQGIAGLKEVVKQHRIAFPDWHEHIDGIVAEGELVAIRFTSTGTQRGPFAGMAPTGRKVLIHEIAMFRLVDGKIVEQWDMPDVNGLLMQLKSPPDPRGG